MKKAGIYVISNTLDERCYVGSSFDIDNRWKRHVRDLSNKRHHSIYLQRFVDKHSIAILKFTVVEHCSKQELIAREQYYLETVNCEFNICKIAGSCLGITRTLKFKEQISKLTKGINNPTYGLIRNKEWRDKISDANKGQTAWNKGKIDVYSKDTLAKMRDSGKLKTFSLETRTKIAESKYKPIHQYNKDGSFIKSWESIQFCAITLNLHESNIIACAKGKLKTVKGFIFRYEYADSIIINLLHKSSKPIVQMDKNYNIIREWNSAKEAATIMNKNNAPITVAAKHGTTAYGYYWKYAIRH